MNNMQKQYHAFIESECTRLGCKDVIKPLQEGFAAMCEAEFDEEAERNGALAGLDKCAGCGCDLEPGEADENGYCPDCSRYSDVCPSCGRKRPGLYPHLSDGFCQECERKTFGDGDPYAEEGIG